MQNKEDFSVWLDTNTILSKNTVKKYVNAINTISKELTDANQLVGSLYNITNVSILESKINTYLTLYGEKDNRGNRMYSSALKYYKKYIESQTFKQD